MKVHVVIATVALATLFCGCVSVESTKAKLESGDAQSVRQAEETIKQQARNYQQLSIEERIQYIKLTKNPEVLFFICHDNGDGKIKSAAARQIDFSQKGVFVRFIKECGYDIDDIEGSSDFIQWMLNSVPMEELITAFRQLENRTIDCDSNLKTSLYKKLAQTVTSEDVLFELLSGRMATQLDSSDKSVALSKINDQSKLMTLFCNYASDEDKTAVIQKIREDTICDFIRKDERLGKYIGKAKLLSRVQDNKKLAKALIERENPDGAQSVVEVLAERSQTALASVVALAKSAKVKEWAMERIKDKNVVKQMILSKHVDDALKIQLADRLETGDVDEATYAAATSEAVKKALYGKLTPEGRATLRKADRANCEKMIEAAKAKSSETFQLGGFYLGMSIVDAERLVGYYFPKYETVVKDGELFIAGQSDSFCLADKSGKVIELNFDDKFQKSLLDFYSTDLNERVIAYSVQNGIDWSFRAVDKFVKKSRVRSSKKTSGDSFDEDDDEELEIFQLMWQWKDNVKHYRLTYFGKRNMSDEDKELARDLTRYFRLVNAEEGVLRARIENEHTGPNDAPGKEAFLLNSPSNDPAMPRELRADEVVKKVMTAIQRGNMDASFAKKYIVRRGLDRFRKEGKEWAASNFPPDVTVSILKIEVNTDETNALVFWKSERNGKPVIEERAWEMIKEDGHWKMFF